jgi:hypothetical protein
MSANDIRRLENQPGIGTKGDRYLEPANMAEAGAAPMSADNFKRLLEDTYNLISKGGK